MKIVVSEAYAKRNPNSSIPKDRIINVETTSLSNDQYTIKNPYDNEKFIIIHDGDIDRIIDDARIGAGRCRYCGQTVHGKEEAEQHFLERESKVCKEIDANTKCFYAHRKFDGAKAVEHLSVPGKTNCYEEITRQLYHYECSYNESGKEPVNCTHQACRSSGISWFDETNTFFIKYPNNFKQGIINLRNMPPEEWEIKDYWRSIKYRKCFGSYALELQLAPLDGQTTIDWSGMANIRRCVIENMKKSIKFCIDPSDMTFIIYDGINASPRICKNLFDTDNLSNAAIDAQKKAVAVILSLIQTNVGMNQI